MVVVVLYRRNVVVFVFEQGKRALPALVTDADGRVTAEFINQSFRLLEMSLSSPAGM